MVSVVSVSRRMAAATNASLLSSLDASSVSTGYGINSDIEFNRKLDDVKAPWKINKCVVNNFGSSLNYKLYLE